MLKIEAQNYKFCPYCGDELEIRIVRKLLPPPMWDIDVGYKESSY